MLGGAKTARVPTASEASKIFTGHTPGGGYITCRGYGYVPPIWVFFWPGGGGTSLWVRRGCAPVLGSFWPENSGIGVSFYWKISVIGV